MKLRRLLLINHEYPPIGGGGGNATYHLARELTKKGLAVAVLTSRYKDQSRSEGSEGFQIWRVPVWRRCPYRSNPIEMLSFAVSGCLYASYMLKAFRPQVVLGFFALPGGLIARYLQNSYRLPYLISLRGGDVPGFWPSAYRQLHQLSAPLLRWVGDQASFLVANSPGLAHLASNFWKAQQNRIFWIPNGIDTRFFYPQRPPDLPPLQVVTAGRLTPQKGVDLLIRAMAGLPQEVLSLTRLTVIGDGPHRRRLQNLTHQLGVKNLVRFTGWLSREKLCQQYQRSHLFVLLSQAEGMSNALLEAMACGLPVIATKVFGTTEVVQENRNGFLIPPEDTQLVTKYWHQIMKHPELLFSFRQSSVATAQQFSWETTAAAYHKLLSLISGE